MVVGAVGISRMSMVLATELLAPKGGPSLRLGHAFNLGRLTPGVFSFDRITPGLSAAPKTLHHTHPADGYPAAGSGTEATVLGWPTRSKAGRFRVPARQRGCRRQASEGWG